MKRGELCTDDCTVDCGHCKGAGKAAFAQKLHVVRWSDMEGDGVAIYADRDEAIKFARSIVEVDGAWTDCDECEAGLMFDAGDWVPEDEGNVCPVASDLGQPTDGPTGGHVPKVLIKNGSEDDLYAKLDENHVDLYLNRPVR